MNCLPVLSQPFKVNNGELFRDEDHLHCCCFDDDDNNDDDNDDNGDYCDDNDDGNIYNTGANDDHRDDNDDNHDDFIYDNLDSQTWQYMHHIMMIMMMT